MEPLHKVNLLHPLKANRLSSLGFTLVELMVVVVIIGVLVAVALPVYTSLKKTAVDNAHDANKRTIHGAVQNYVGAHGLPENGFSTEDWQEALEPDFLQEWPTHPGDEEGDYKVKGDFSYEVVFE